MSHIKNIERGKIYESDAIKQFEDVSKCKIERCGFFNYPHDNKYGCSPDGLGPSGILLEVKTRAAFSESPLKKYKNRYIYSNSILQKHNLKCYIP